MKELHQLECDILHGKLVAEMVANGMAARAPEGEAAFLMKAADSFKVRRFHAAASRAKELACHRRPLRETLFDKRFMRYRARYLRHTVTMWARELGWIR